jgi:hypothetical protein
MAVNEEVSIRKRIHGFPPLVYSNLGGRVFPRNREHFGAICRKSAETPLKSPEIRLDTPTPPDARSLSIRSSSYPVCFSFVPPAIAPPESGDRSDGWDGSDPRVGERGVGRCLEDRHLRTPAAPRMASHLGCRSAPPLLLRGGPATRGCAVPPDGAGVGGCSRWSVYDFS